MNVESENKKLDINTSKVRVYVYAIVSIISFIAVSVGASYAFYAASVIGNEESPGVTIKSMDVAIIYHNNQNIILDNITPGFSETMDFSISNVNTQVGAYGDYKISWEIKTNEINFDDNDDFVYTLTGKSIKDGQPAPLNEYNQVVNIPEERRVPDISTVLGTGVIDIGITHEYTLTVKFIDTQIPQDQLQGKKFNGKIVVIGY